MENKFIPDAIEIVGRAIKADNDSDYEQALNLYRDALGRFTMGLKYEKNESRKKLIIEVNSWFSQQVMAYSFAILAHELLGYEVVFNHVENTGARGVYRRAAGIPNEGEKGKSRRAAAGRAQLLAK